MHSSAGTRSATPAERTEGVFSSGGGLDDVLLLFTAPPPPRARACPTLYTLVLLLYARLFRRCQVRCAWDGAYSSQPRPGVSC